MDFKYLKTKKVNASLWVEIHNPPVNFLTMDLLEELHVLIRKIRKDESIRVFILTGGRDDVYIMHFSIPELLRLHYHNRRMLLNILVKFRPTASLLAYYMTFTNWLMDLSPWIEWLMLKQAKLIRGFSSGMFLWYQMTRLYHAVERMSRVTIAALNGPCNGGGTELSACFDFRFMIGDQGFTIGQPECLVNIVPGGGNTQRLPRLIGRAKALELMLKGTQLTPREAKQIGLVTDVFKKKDFKKKVQDFADMMSRRPPAGILAIKQSVLDGMSTTLSHGLSIELTHSLRCLDMKDTVMAMKEYIKYIDKNINTVDVDRITTKEVVALVKKTTDDLENAKIFRKFEGK
ncbi:MAG: enoyl-CoA hydratase/isomerase family protein [Spirochaetes bacterium]|nr:enoyl-CoA hydratase/isomerase family protein [Spirochaetota bacterium]